MAAAIGAVAGGLGGGSGISDLMGSIFGTDKNVQQNTNSTTSGTTSNLSAEDLNSLRNLISSVMDTNNSAQYSRANAIQDAQGFATSAIRQLKEAGIPGLFNNEAASGAYDSTSRKQLENDLAARTTEAISANTSDVVAKYGAVGNQAQSNQFQLLTNLWNTLKGAQSTHTDKTQSTTNQESSSEGLLSMLNPLGSLGGNPKNGVGVPGFTNAISGSQNLFGGTR